MFAPGLGQEITTIGPGVTTQEAEDIAMRTTTTTVIGSLVLFYLIYRFLVK